MADCKKYNGSTWQHSLRELSTSTDTITTLPADLYADGNNATVGLVGNMVQNGTPTPDSPIMPQGTGDKTANLFDVENVTHETLKADGSISFSSGMNLSGLIAVNGNFTVSWNAIKNGAYMRVSTYDENKNFIERIAERNTYTSSSYSNTHTGYVRINYENDFQLSQIQVNLGSTALPYEPYGIKILISSASTTTPVYLGETQSTRQIKKYICTGDETVDKIDNNIYYLSGALINGAPILGASAICTHYENNPVTSGISVNLRNGQFTLNQVGVGNYSITIHDDINGGNVSAQYKQYLAQQYAAGTPVTVWYVLVTPQTAVVNEPLRKISNYADTVSGISIPTITGKDTFDVETTLKPSEVTVNYKGWHPVADVHERENGAWH